MLRKYEKKSTPSSSPQIDSTLFPSPGVGRVPKAGESLPSTRSGVELSPPHPVFDHLLPQGEKEKMKNLSQGGERAGVGFTLIEAVVAISVFAITATSIVGVYLAVQKLNQQSAALQALQQNGRFITEDLTKIIRNGQIDYASYPNQRVPQPAAVDLYLIDQFGTQIHVSRDGDNRQGDNLIMDKTGIGSTTFSGREVRVLAFQVYIWPNRNPFGGGGAQEQPTVTIFLDLESNINPRDRVRLPFQVTVSTRQYPQ